jgi:PAS domain S-box-containing protein
MLAGLVLLQALSLLLSVEFLIQRQRSEFFQHVKQGLSRQTTTLARQVREALLLQRPDWAGADVKMMGDFPNAAFIKVTDPIGNVLFVSSGEPGQITLNTVERAQIPLAVAVFNREKDQPLVFVVEKNRWECVQPIYTGNDLRGFAWVEANRAWNREQMKVILRTLAIFGAIWMVASGGLVLLMARSISRPLAILHRGTRALMNSPNSPETAGSFPLPVTVQNEIGDLIEAFNRMVATIAEQRAGLNDTLSLLDSMLANAPVGLAFLDRRCRIVRVNQVFAEMTGAPLSRHLGRTLPELLPQPVAQELENAVLRVFAEEEPVRDLELSGKSGSPAQPWTWLANIYPVRTTPQQVRWVGTIMLDASDRKRSEEILRKSEKLAVTGRLAASIAHEINNPLEAITNLLFLLRNYCRLEEPALNYVAMAEHEANRITEITQQTLRFYRQSTLPTRAKIAELLDTVLSLYQSRMNTLNIKLEQDYGSDSEVELFCFAGELRQVLANLVGNAIDASSGGGRLLVRARRSRNWNDPAQTGVRLVVADTGTGMEPAVRERIFEAFFTTKEVTGTGLGLWVSHEIIVKHGGLAHVRSRTAAQGKPSGTVFQLFFPDELNPANSANSTNSVNKTSAV